ncbi:nuclear transport factor 2 family protein [Azoarcus sp. DN11]|uniref:nuclear transport factor 2 family protein n=1 Tax=Azoarcus sp. DN11 TaxID=356837 RepID=UPI000EB1D1C8|nr:nuclear transport factor 2 family protein [Azoarcus sp. DN11]AYH44463.1 hypothetical protein CDA09_13885 [Azoarcus sp. DN11]
MSIDAKVIEHFLHTQLARWNASDKEGFLAAYREVAPGGLTIEYVGRPSADGWPVLEAMWTAQNAKIDIEEVAMIINGCEAACHNRNRVKGTDVTIETIELYRFDEGGKLHVRYFIRQP